MYVFGKFQNNPVTHSATKKLQDFDTAGFIFLLPDRAEKNSPIALDFPIKFMLNVKFPFLKTEIDIQQPKKKRYFRSISYLRCSREIQIENTRN